MISFIVLMSLIVRARSLLFQPKTQRLLRVAAVGSWAAIAALSLLPWPERPHAGMSGIVEQAIAYAVSGFVTRLVLQNASSRVQILAYSAAAAVLETCQLWIPGRSGGVDHWLAGSLGAFIGIFAARLIAHPPGRTGVTSWAGVRASLDRARRARAPSRRASGPK